MNEASDLKITSESKIKFFPLTIQPGRKGKIIIGSKRTNSFIIVDSYWSKLTEIAKKEGKVLDIVHELEKDNINFVSPHSLSKVKIMLLFFAKYRLIQKINGEILIETRKTRSININPKIIGILTNKLFVAAYTLLAVLGILFFVLTKFSALNPENFFWSKYLSLTFSTYFLFTVFMIVVHEFAHFVAAKRFGLTGSFSLSNRLQFLVVESKFPNMYSISKKGRIIVFLSGTLIDLATIGILYLILLNLKDTANFLIIRELIKQFLLLEWVAILWQFLFYMKTDMYFVIKELVNVENLYTYAKERTLGFVKKDRKLPVLTKKENYIVSIYTVLFILGTALGIWRYLTIHLPITIRFMFQSLSNLFTGVFTNNFILAIDGFVVLVIEIIFLTLFIKVVVKRR